MKAIFRVLKGQEVVFSYEMEFNQVKELNELFQTGDVLTAAQVNTYLNEQTVMVFANAAARSLFASEP